ncbi:MAG TPA: heavy-metal-associated domain-containing protein [Candidatus Norongarragalinales archaeon]|nr:heavy-metal-associated domain-containing protein [Candidatus Norongarragalinales archaeon]
MTITAKRFIVLGVDCEACATTIEKAVRKLDGVKRADMSANKGTLEIEFDGGREAERKILAKVGMLGYKIA